MEKRCSTPGIRKVLKSLAPSLLRARPRTKRIAERRRTCTKILFLERKSYIVLGEPCPRGFGLALIWMFQPSPTTAQPSLLNSHLPKADRGKGKISQSTQPRSCFKAIRIHAIVITRLSDLASELRSCDRMLMASDTPMIQRNHGNTRSATVSPFHGECAKYQ